jgi:hypothetical protein
VGSDARGCDRRARTSLARGPGSAPPGSAAVDRYCVLELERELEPGARAARRACQISPTPSPRSAGHGRSGRRRPGAVQRAAGLAAVGIGRCCDRGDAASGRGHASDSFRAELTRELLSRLPSPTGTRRSPRRSIGWELSLSRTSRSGPSSCAGALAGLLGDTWELRAAVLLGDASEERRATTLPCGHSPRASRRRSAPRTPSAARLSRRCGTATGPHSSARSTTSCSDCARRRGWLTQRRPDRDASVTNT